MDGDKKSHRGDKCQCGSVKNKDEFGGYKDMSNLILKIKNIKNIKEFELAVPISKGIYCLVGANGCGKSTIMRSLAQSVFSSSIQEFKEEDFYDDASVEFDLENKTTIWKYNPKNNRWFSDVSPEERIHFDGLYEGSLFYGTRFDDSLSVDNLYKGGKIKNEDIVDADEYVRQKLSFILHGDTSHYSDLKRIRNKEISKKLRLKNTPYFQKTRNGLISQYRMSSGECLLISLLHFIYNALIRRSLPANKPILMLIDEIELALHPVAVTRLIELIEEIQKEHENLVVYLSSHSPEVIRKINPRNIYMLEYNIKRESVDVTNPCYPSYAIRDVYIHDGYDYVVLVEDYLAKNIVEEYIKKLKLNQSRLINVLPVGGWENVLALHNEIYSHNTLGIGTKIFSILDGDAEKLITKQYKSYPKLFLPIQSVEKYLYQILILKPDRNIKKQINDMFFSVESIDDILSGYYIGNTKNDRNGKTLFKKLIDILEKRKISEEIFVSGIAKIIMENYDFSDFEKGLKKMF